MTVERNQNGAIKGTSGPSRLLDAMEPGKVYTTGEIRDELDVDVTRRTVYNWLDSLHEDGRVQRRKANERLILWSR